VQWADSMLKIMEELASESERFRHGLSLIPASRIASQYYCEQKVEMEYTTGAIETEAKTRGEEIHESLLKMRKTTLKEIIDGIQKERVYVASFPIVAEFSNIMLAGIPDLIVFVKGQPAFIVELKTTEGDVSKLWRDQVVQAKVYGLILEEMGFDCSRLKLAIVRHKRNGDLSKDYKREFLHSLIASLLKGTRYLAKYKKNGAFVHIINYARTDVVPDVQWAEGYWLSKRTAIPTRKVSKCRVCEYSGSCPSSLVRLPSVG